MLDYYFEQVNMAVWPRFTTVFDTYLSTLQNIHPKTFRQVEQTFGLKNTHQRYADLQMAFYTLYGFFQDNKMLLSRINSLKQEYFKFLARVT